MLPSAGSAKALIINMQNNKMKIFRNIFLAALAASFLSCSGNVDDSSLPILEASDTEIDLATETEAVLTVRYNGVDVTDDAQIVSVSGMEDFDGKVFRPKNTGSETFYASYNGKESDQITVNVINTRPEVESIYDRNVFVAEFTGASCAFCPAGYDNMMMQLARPALAKYKQNIHIASFHSEEMGKDSLAIAATMDIKNMFSALELPSYAVDLRDSGGLNTEGLAGFNAALKDSFEDYEPHCGVAVSSFVNSDRTSVGIQVRVSSELTSEYRVIVLIVQDGIKGYQKHGEYGELDDYIHKHVVRALVTANAGKGEKMADGSLIPEGSEASKTWSVDIDRRWVLENTKVYALALDSNGYVNNMNVCAIDGGDSGYDLK